MQLWSKLYGYRFELLLAGQVAILFGGLVLPLPLFETVASPVLFALNLLIGVLLFSASKKKMFFVVILLVIAVFSLLFEFSTDKPSHFVKGLKLFPFFLFFLLLVIELMSQIWSAKVIGKNVIYGLISGYIALGFIAFFVCLSIETFSPGSYNGIPIVEGISSSEDLMYYSYITLMTIGYGEIVPETMLAKKAAVLIGLMGQFYLVILTAIVVGKFVNQRKPD